MRSALYVTSFGRIAIETETRVLYVKRIIEAYFAYQAVVIAQNNLGEIYYVLSTLAHPNHWGDNEWDANETNRQILEQQKEIRRLAEQAEERQKEMEDFIKEMAREREERYNFLLNSK